MTDKLEITGKFETGCLAVKAESIPAGHINDTYLITCDTSERFILQKLNSFVFKDIPALQENIERVTVHLRKKLSSRPGSDPSREVLSLVPAIDGKTWREEPDGSFWRVFRYIENHVSYEKIESDVVAAEAGRAIGRFQSDLADLPAPPLSETIKGFHDLTGRFLALQAAINLNKSGRAKEVMPVVREMEKDYRDMRQFIRTVEDGFMPLRVTHNDTKVNNILFDTTGKALCVIDLDTVMPGTILYDFGDAIRTGANSGSEDEVNLKNVFLKLGIFRPYSRGYLDAVGDTLTTTEKKNLAFGPLAITWEQTVRFLTDYINGDVYYKVKDPGHNLRRTLAQRQLLRSLKDGYDSMDKIIAEYS